MRCTRLLSAVPGGSAFTSKRHLVTKPNPPKSSLSRSETRRPESSRFLPARPGIKVATRNAPQPRTIAPAEMVPRKRISPYDDFTPEEMNHYIDVGSPEPAKSDYLSFAFPRGLCPRRAWWDRQKPAEPKPSDFNWTSGKMYPHFWKRCGVALKMSGCFSSLLGGAGVVSLISHTDGPVPTNLCVSVFTALALPTFIYGVFRSRTLQEAWMGLVGAHVPTRGHSMMPYIHASSKWSYTWWFRHLHVKAGDIISFRNPVQHDPRFDQKHVFWLGKRVIAVEFDVVKMEKLGFPDETYFQVPKGHVFVLGDNRHGGNSLDSRQFGPVPLYTLRGRTTAFTTKSNPIGWRDWEKIPKMETDVFIVKDPLDREATRAKWEGKSWDSIPRWKEPALEGSAYKPEHYRLKVHRSRKR